MLKKSAPTKLNKEGAQGRKRQKPEPDVAYITEQLTVTATRTRPVYVHFLANVT